MWLMEFVVGQTAQSLTCSIVEKLQTGLDDCLNMLLSRFRRRMSADGGREGEPRLRQLYGGGGGFKAHSYSGGDRPSVLTQSSFNRRRSKV